MDDEVVISKQAAKDIRSAPKQVVAKLMAWVKSVETIGLRETRKHPGFHDEPLKGARKGQRSIRLNKQWRAVYVETDKGRYLVATVQEVHPHDY